MCKTLFLFKLLKEGTFAKTLFGEFNIVTFLLSYIELIRFHQIQVSRKLQFSPLCVSSSLTSFLFIYPIYSQFKQVK